MGSLRVRFWGTRGMISSPRLDTAFFGGNTPCLQILHGDHLILVDTGFGCAILGDEILPEVLLGSGGVKIHIFYTHFHWDHIQGLPFFKPIYFSNTAMHLYSPVPTPSMLENLNILFDGSYSPFESLLSMQARVHLHELGGDFDLDGLKVEHHPVDHGTEHDESGALAFAYKFTDSATGDSVCIITDHEAKPGDRNQKLVEWAKGSDLLIHDGQYTTDSYLSHQGWGHSSAAAALENALQINPAMTLLTHHDPASTDRDLKRQHRQLLGQSRFRQLSFAFAREDIIYDVAKVNPKRKAS